MYVKGSFLQFLVSALVEENPEPRGNECKLYFSYKTMSLDHIFSWTRSV